MTMIALILLGLFMLAWAMRGMMTGQIRWKIWTYERERRPVLFWLQVAFFGFAGAVLLATGIRVLIGVIKS